MAEGYESVTSARNVKTSRCGRHKLLILTFQAEVQQWLSGAITGWARENTLRLMRVGCSSKTGLLFRNLPMTLFDALLWP
jgi:hypothetical protein